MTSHSADWMMVATEVRQQILANRTTARGVALRKILIDYDYHSAQIDEVFGPLPFG